MHPDKAVAQGVPKEEAEETFKKLQDAYATLSDPAKRKEFDSLDEFDDYLPSTCDAADFFKVFGPAFKRQSKWSEKKAPVLGDEATDFARVQAFYDFWFRFKSWRIFPHPDEEDEEQASGRDERRWIQKHNERLRSKAKKEETKRIREFVDAAWACDPRVAAAHLEKKKHREKNRQAKQEAREQRLAEQRRAAAEARAAKEAELAAAKQREEEQRAREKDEKRQMREFRAHVAKACRARELASNEEIAFLCDTCVLSEFEALATALDGTAGVAAERSAVAGVLEGVRARVAAEEAERAARAAEVGERLANEGQVSHARKLEEMGEWSEEELHLLDKGMKKYPVGTKSRWEAIAAYIRSRTAAEVIVMVKEHLAKGKIPNSLVKDGIVIKEKYKGNLAMKQDADTRDAAFTDVRLPDAKDRADLATPSAAVTSVGEQSGAWTAGQEQALVNAMKTFGKEMADRWDRIAMAVPGKSKAECVARFKELQKAFQEKKKGPAANGDPAEAKEGEAKDSAWSLEEEQRFVKALKTVPKDADGRWEKIAELAGKTPKECKQKFLSLKAAHQKKKEG